MKLQIEQIGNRKICLGGVGTLFHQNGFPIGISAKKLQEQGIELSWFHVIKELEYQFSSLEKLFTKVSSELEDASVEGIKFDVNLLKQFCFADWEQRRSMIYDYLWANESKETIKQFFNDKLKTDK